MRISTIICMLVATFGCSTFGSGRTDAELAAIAKDIHDGAAQCETVNASTDQLQQAIQEDNSLASDIESAQKAIQTLEKQTVSSDLADVYKDKKDLLERKITYLKLQQQYIKSRIEQLKAAAPPVSIVSEKFVLNVKICFFYTGDGNRPLDPRKPTAKEVGNLLSGDVYFSAVIKDTASGLESVNIQSDIIRDLIISTNGISYNYDIFYGAPTESLEVHVGVFDDDGLPSDRKDKLLQVQKAIGHSL